MVCNFTMQDHICIKKDNLEILNPDLHDYYPAIKEITKNGGWVIRIGDKTMEKLDQWIMFMIMLIVI